MAMFDALLAVDPNSLQSAAGLAGKVYLATDTARTSPLEVTDLNGIPYANQQIVAGPNGFVPAFLTPGDEVAVVWVSGPWVFPLKSIEGVDAKATTAQMTASEALSRADAALAGGGTGGGNVTVDTLSGATAIGKAVVKATTPDAARGAIGAGTSNVTVGTGAGQAQAAANAVRTDGNQTITGVKTFSAAPVVPQNSFQQDRIVGLVQALTDLANGGGTPAPQLPVASFTSTTTALAATFTSTATAPSGRTIVSYHWNFGEGGGIVTEGDPVRSHNFAAAGTHAVSHFVIDSEGEQSASVSQSITVAAPANVGPTASFTASVSGSTVALNASASSDPDGAISSYAWQLGYSVNGTPVTATGVSPIHTYPSAGTYTVALTVTDTGGLTAETTRAVTITPTGTDTGTAGVTFVWVDSATPNDSQNKLATEMTARGATLLRLPDTTTDADLTAALNQPNRALIVMDGTSTANLTANVFPVLNTAAKPAILLKYGVTDELGWTTAASVPGANTSIYVREAEVSEITSAGKSAGAHPIQNPSSTVNYWTSTVVPTEYDGRLFANTAGSQLVEFVMPATDTRGWRLAASYYFNSTAAANWLPAVFDFVYAAMVEAAGLARTQVAAIAAPVVTSLVQTLTTSTGGDARAEFDCLADADLQVFEIRSYGTTGAPIQTFAAADSSRWIGGDPTKRFRNFTNITARMVEVWAKQVRASDPTVVSAESNHRQVNVTAATPTDPNTPVVPVTSAVALEPFKNSVGEKFEMGSGATPTQGATIPPVWWLGQPVSGVVYEPDASAGVPGPITADFRRLDVAFTINQGQYGHQVRQATSSDPLTIVRDRGDSNRALIQNHPTLGDLRVHIPSNMQAAVGDDGHAHVVQPPDAQGRVYVVEMIGFARVNETEVSASRVHKIPMDGAGIGPASGVRAYGGSAVAGLIRSHEVDQSHVAYTGKIPHVLAWAASWRQMRHMPHPTRASIDQWLYFTSGVTDQDGQPGWPTGMRRAGPSDQPGSAGFMMRQHAFPTSEEDYTGKNDYFGQIPMGQLFALPPEHTLASLGITMDAYIASGMTQDAAQRRLWAATMLFEASRDYGWMLVDTVGAGASCPLYVETNAPTTFRTAISQGSTWPDAKKIRARMRAVQGARTHTTPNGGSLTVARRGKAVPGFP